MNWFASAHLFLTVKVDPFAIEQAGKQLQAAKRSVSRRDIVAVYTACGRLDTFVQHYIEQTKTDSEASVESAMKAQLRADPDWATHRKSPRFVAPFRLGLLMAAAGMLAVFAQSAVFLYGWTAKGVVTIWGWATEIAVAVVLLAASFGYTYLGAHLGRARAKKIVGGALLVIIAAALAWIVHIELS